MTVYLVDFENVRSSGLKGVENLGEDDKVIIFYSKNADAITFDVHMLLSKSMAEIETYMILRGGRNSLDFQLSTYLGYLVMENRFRNIVIISEDKGFLCAINFWEENRELCNVDIKMAKSIEAFESNDLFNEMENVEGSFIQKLSVIPAKSSTSEVRETVRVNAKDSRNAHLKKSDNLKDKAIKKAKAVFAQKSVDKKSTERKLKEKQQKEKHLKEKKTDTKKVDVKKVDTKKVDVKKVDAKGTGAKKITEKNNPECAQQSQVRLAEKEEPKVVKGKAPKGTQTVQNPTSKNKIFVAEVKLNIVEDVREILGEKYGEEYVPLMVEAIGKSTGKQHLYRMLVSKFGQKLGKELYQSIKGQYVNLKRK